MMIPDYGVSAFWPAAGFAAVALLWARTPKRRAGTLVAIALAYVTLTIVSLSYGRAEVGFTVANTLEPLVVLPFLQRATRNDGRLTNLTSLIWLLLGAAIAPFVSALIAATWATVVGMPQGWASIAVDWWAGDALGILVFAPVMLQARPLRNLWSLGRPWEQVLVWALFVASTVQLVTGPSIGLITLAGLVLVGLRLDTSAASLATFFAASVMAWLSLQPSSLFETTGAGENIDGRVLIVITAVTAQLVALATSARRRATTERDSALTEARSARIDTERANESLAESQNTLRLALDSSLDAFAVYQRSSGQWRLVFANVEAARRARLPGAAQPGSTLDAVVPLEAIYQIRGMMDTAASTGQSQRLIADLRKSSSSWQGHFSITTSPTPDGRVVVTWRDVTDEQATQQHLRAAHAAAMHAATHDSLTNLPNRGLFRDRLNTSLAALSRSGLRVALIFIDLDNFKAINDHYGHLAGDAVLMALARRLTALVRDSDSVARLGGDEFVILLPGVDENWDPSELHQRLIDALAEPIEVRGGHVVLGVSIGVVVVDASGPSGDELLHMADLAMYESKSKGKGQLTIWTDNLATSPAPNRITDADIRRALLNNEFFLEYQPVIDLTTSTTVGYEALVRWAHRTFGVLPPDQFLGLADDFGLTVPLGEWVLDHAITDLSHLPPGPWMSVNLAAQHLAQRDVATHLQVRLAQRNIPGSRLVVELTEGHFMASSPSAIHRLEEIRALGVRIAIDDFGAGYSSLAYLQVLPFDVVKIDRGVIAGSITQRTADLLAWVNELSAKVDATMILEGVETPEQLALARSTGIRYAQGFLLGRPAPLPETIPSRA